MEHPICSWTPAIPYLPTTTAGAAFCFCLSISITTSSNPESQKGCSFLLTTRLVPSPPRRKHPHPHTPKDKTTSPTCGLRSPIIQQKPTIAK
ncbi:hypothetical protein CDAR_50831 [Caerostris darwini]|uniref:Uncharacterized protein n=1 Tax=Caerostris darwini TaxID=1538125 RepID=A0AAV4U5P7_9ARAC|nr:hypothetical protein CDAR_50831 [Caerostris darwini]